MRIANTVGRMLGRAVVLTCVTMLATVALGEDPKQAAVVIGPQAPELERYAAEELCGYLKKLYGIQTQPTDAASPDVDMLFLIGSPKSNPAVGAAVGAERWPVLSDQGLMIKPVQSDGKLALVIGGGSPRATLWAVYELVERWGVRYLLHGDVLPEKPGKLRLPEEDVVLEPKLTIRQWRVVNDFPSGPESWGMADYRPVLDQLAKLKFNRIIISTYPWQPFLHLEVDGVARREAWLWFRWHYPITDDMPGRHLFGDAKEFWNPDLPMGASYEDFSAAGERLLHNLMAYAHQRGMECVLGASVTMFPHEFKDMFHGAKPLSGMSRYTMIPGPETKMDDPGLIKLATAVLRTSVNTYPEADYLQLGVTEVRKWSGEYERAWKTLDAKYGLSKVQPPQASAAAMEIEPKKTWTLDELLAKANQRRGYPGGASRAVSEVKGDLAVLAFLDDLIRERQVLRDTKRPDVKLVYYALAEELYPLLGRILPPGSETLNFVDYTPTRILRRQETLAALGGTSIPATLIYTLHDDNVGLLPHLATGSLHQLTQELFQHGWAGFSTRYWMISDHDPCVAYLARVSWDARATPEAVYADLFEHVCGEAAAEDLTRALAELERTSAFLELHCLGLAFATPGMFTKHERPGPMPESYAKVREGYRRALVPARAAAAKSRPAGKAFAEYWVGRLEFGVGYFDCIEALRRATTLKAQAEKLKQSGDAEAAAQTHAEAVTAMNRTVDLSRSMLQSYARVAADQSDRGAIATMAEYVYRPLKAKALTAASEKAK